LRSFSLFTAWLFIFWHKEIGAKVAYKMLVKLTAGVNFINILGANFFVQKYFAQLFTISSLAFYFLAQGNRCKSCL
jgi:hypothetical protein